MKNLTILTASLALFAVSCSNNETVVDETPNIQECYYTVNESSVVVNWVAYKFTEKEPVQGTFNEVNITGFQTLNSLDNLISGLSFEIPINSINSNNPERDGKIQETFFGSLAETSVIKGYVVSANKDELTLSLSLNGLTKEVKGTSTFENGLYTFKANLDLKVFNASAAVDALNELCYDLHIGADGISKLWDEVEIRFQCRVNEDC